MFRRFLAVAAVAAAAVLVGSGAFAGAAPPVQLSGAIFTTDASGFPVNLNIYAAKEDVYLNGGPGINAPTGAAGLPAGTYTFQVTDPSGKTLLSTDDARCRQFTVDDSGVIKTVLTTGPCPAHLTGGLDEDGGLTVQLMPYDDTPNNGGEYKVWVTPTSLLDCGAAGNKHCFVPRFSKTDNYKVRSSGAVEIDTRFSRPGVSGYIDGLGVTWVDTLGASNMKFSEYAPERLAFHEAHVEAAEVGTHTIIVSDQPGCTILDATSAGKTYTPVGGTVTVPVTVKNGNTKNDVTYRVEVHCA